MWPAIPLVLICLSATAVPCLSQTARPERDVLDVIARMKLRYCMWT